MSDHDPAFQSALDQDTVVLGEIVRAKVMSSPSLTPDGPTQAIGERYYPLLLQSFRDRHKGVQLVIQEDVGCGVALHTSDQDDPAGDKIDWAVIRRTLRYDWTKPRALLIETQELADEARRWLRNGERGDMLGALYNIMTQIGATIARENRLRAEGHDEGTGPSDRIESDVATIATQLNAARKRFRADIERGAQSTYATGMVLGALGMLALYGVLAWILAEEHIPAVDGVALIAGAVGGCVSVLERMTRGKLEINAQSGNEMLLAFGAGRAVVGGIFGYLIYLVIRSELISIFVLPKGSAAKLAYVAVFGFVAGFNERFAQDVLANASNTRRDD